jgi:hypothetical protein
MAIPKKDSGLAAWSTNFKTRTTLVPADFDMVAADCTAYAAVHDPYIAALAAVNTVGARSKALVVEKDTKKRELLRLAREFYAKIQSSLTVSDANKTLVNIVVRNPEPTPVPVPATEPVLAVKSVNGRTVTITMRDAANAERRGKPPGVSGAAVFSHVGPTAPAAIEAWKFEGNTGRTTVDVVFPASVAPGAQVWLTAFWFNPRKQSGPACTPVGTHVQFGGVSMAA